MRAALVGLALAMMLAVILSACQSKAGEESRSPGELAFRASCQTCHRLPDPGSKADGEWPALVARYGERAKLSPKKIAAVTEYLQAANRR